MAREKETKEPFADKSVPSRLLRLGGGSYFAVAGAAHLLSGVISVQRGGLHAVGTPMILAVGSAPLLIGINILQRRPVRFLILCFVLFIQAFLIYALFLHGLPSEASQRETSTGIEGVVTEDMIIDEYIHASVYFSFIAGSLSSEVYEGKHKKLSEHCLSLSRKCTDESYGLLLRDYDKNTAIGYIQKERSVFLNHIEHQIGLGDSGKTLIDGYFARFNLLVTSPSEYRTKYVSQTNSSEGTEN